MHACCCAACFYTPAYVQHTSAYAYSACMHAAVLPASIRAALPEWHTHTHLYTYTLYVPPSLPHSLTHSLTHSLPPSLPPSLLPSLGGYLELRRDSVCMLTYADVFSLCLSRWLTHADIFSLCVCRWISGAAAWFCTRSCAGIYHSTTKI
jgi:hypothetical protein